MIQILGKECLFDNYLLDTEKTTAPHLLHHPVKKELTMTFDRSWEGDAISYPNFFYDPECRIYRMYYISWWKPNPAEEPQLPEHTNFFVCYAESKDGLTWERPNVGLCEWQGSTDNNIILWKPHFDNFYVFYDTNPDCKPGERYKAVASSAGTGEPKKLDYYVSTDAVHFVHTGELTRDGEFDSLNIVFYDEHSQKYRCYFRGHYSAEKPRPITYIESKTFEPGSWSEAVDLTYEGAVEEVHLYTNVIQPYDNSSPLFVGMPTRYVERRNWTATYDEMPAREKRLGRMKYHWRYGLAITDCLFMCSRDGINFRRYDNAFLRPCPEDGTNWVYGDCYPAVGFLKTPPVRAGSADELSIFVLEDEWMYTYQTLYRYALRQDGFVSLHADESERVVVTKPFVFEGDELYANMETSAWGHIYFALIDENGERMESIEVFGNSIAKRVHFPTGPVNRWQNKVVRLEARMVDADLYTIAFKKND